MFSTEVYGYIGATTETLNPSFFSLKSARPFIAFLAYTTSRMHASDVKLECSVFASDNKTTRDLINMHNANKVYNTKRNTLSKTGMAVI